MEDDDDDFLMDDRDDPELAPFEPFEDDQTLLELSRGPNREAALYEIEDRVFNVAVLMNFIAIRLVNTSGGQHPYTFDDHTRQL